MAQMCSCVDGGKQKGDLRHGNQDGGMSQVAGHPKDPDRRAEQAPRQHQGSEQLVTERGLGATGQETRPDRGYQHPSGSSGAVNRRWLTRVEQ
jgi:hypothetical protein